MGKGDDEGEDVYERGSRVDFDLMKATVLDYALRYAIPFQLNRTQSDILLHG